MPIPIRMWNKCSICGKIIKNGFCLNHPEKTDGVYKYIKTDKEMEECQINTGESIRSQRLTRLTTLELSADYGNLLSG